jgi:hypothetical protein
MASYCLIWRRRARLQETRLSITKWAASCAAALLAATGAQAQDSAAPAAAAPAAATPPAARVIRAGDRVPSEIGDDDPAIADRHYEDFTIALGRGVSIQIDMESGEIDSYLEIFSAGSNSALDSNDDAGGGSVNARLFFVAPDDGNYTVRAQQFAPGENGRYTLSVSQLPPPPRPRVLAGRVDDAIDANAPIFYDRQRRATYRYRPFVFEGVAGERVLVEMSSGQLDSYLQISAEGDTAVLASDNDGGENLNARAFLVLPGPGLRRYIIRAATPPGQTGRYTLALVRRASPPEAEPAQIARDAWVDGALTIESPLRMGPTGRPSYFYKLYAVPVTGGETLTVELRSNEFTPVLDAGAMTPLGFGQVQTSFDFRRPPQTTRAGRIARLVLHPQRDGLVHIRARGTALNMGNFGLRITAGDNPASSVPEAPTPPAASPGGN